jgi:hypothetical protein
MTAIHAELFKHADPRRTSRSVWAGRILSGIAVLFLAMDATMKVLLAGPVVAGSAKLGFTPHDVVALGVIQFACLLTYLLPRTAILGAVLWTGYLGGAIATHVRLHDPLFSHTLFPFYVAVLLWGGLRLRDPRTRQLLGTR